MGHCGCADFGADYQLPGPHGIVYGIQFYQGCTDCDVPAGIIVHRFLREGMGNDFCVNELPELPISPYSPQKLEGELLIPVISVDCLLKALQKAMGNGKLTVDGEEYAVGDFVADALEHEFLLRNVMADTYQDWRKEIEARKIKEKGGNDG